MLLLGSLVTDSRETIIHVGEIHVYKTSYLIIFPDGNGLIGFNFLMLILCFAGVEE